jgi:hypothetical protein
MLIRDARSLDIVDIAGQVQAPSAETPLGREVAYCGGPYRRDRLGSNIFVRTTERAAMSRPPDAMQLRELPGWMIRIGRSSAASRGWIFGLMTVVLSLSATATLLGQLNVLQLPHSDRESWPEVDVVGRAASHLELTLVSQARLSTGLPNPELWLLGVDAEVPLNRHLLMTPSYYYFRFDQGGSTNHGQNVVLATTFRQSAGRYTIDDRNRVIGFLIPGTDFWVYGYRLRVERSIGPEEKRMALIGSDELFFFSNTDTWQRNRLALSFHKGITDLLAVEPYLLHQTDGHISPGHLNGFGVILKVTVH